MMPHDSAPAHYNAVIAAQVQASRQSMLRVTRHRQEVRGAIIRSLRSPGARLLAASVAFVFIATRGRQRNTDKRKTRASGGVIASGLGAFVVSEAMHHAALWVRRVVRREDSAPRNGAAAAHRAAL